MFWGCLGRIDDGGSDRHPQHIPNPVIADESSAEESSDIVIRIRSRPVRRFARSSGHRQGGLTSKFIKVGFAIAGRQVVVADASATIAGGAIQLPRQGSFRYPFGSLYLT